jgi:hypothetical protein
VSTKGYGVKNMGKNRSRYLSGAGSNNLTDLIPVLVFIGDQIKKSPSTRYWDWMNLQSDPNLLEN